MGEEKKDHYLELNKVLTHVITWGQALDSNGKDVIMCITGNPGLPEFYTEFAYQLHIQTGLSVCVIGQAGHEDLPNKQIVDLNDQSHLFNLEGQIQHKLDFFNKLDKKSKFHIIGHSIGAWEVVEIINREPDLIHRVASINLLFPTLQKMVDSKNGKFLNSVIRCLHIFVIFLVHLFCILPQVIQDYLLMHYLNHNSLSIEYIARFKKFLNPYVVNKVLLLAYNEMDTVTILNTEGLDKIKHLTNIIYSTRDDWAPLSYIEDLKMFQPYINLQDVNINHSFVLKSSIRVADMVVKLIKKNTATI